MFLDQSLLFLYYISEQMRNVKEKIDDLLERKATVSAGEVAREAGVTRQAAHAHLRALARLGVLFREGRGRATRYRKTTPEPAGARVAGEPAVGLSLRLAGLQEDLVWKDLDFPPARGQTEIDTSIFRYAFLEILDNAIEHSGGSEVDLRIWSGERLAFEIADDGVGIFEHIRASLGLADRLEALQDLSKGKLTTKPERHTGEGIFFVSKAASRFEISSGGLRWAVDNLIPDQAVLSVAERSGTRVRFELVAGQRRRLEELFAEYTEDFRFSRTRTVVKLFSCGASFVSRSEARRLLSRLERFSEVLLDFAGIDGVGQGFVDEIFRVWARAHPQVRLVPVNMNKAVEFMVRRGLARDDGP